MRVGPARVGGASVEERAGGAIEASGNETGLWSSTVVEEGVLKWR